MHPTESQVFLAAFTCVVSCDFTATLVLNTGSAHFSLPVSHKANKHCLRHLGRDLRLPCVSVLGFFLF